MSILSYVFHEHDSVFLSIIMRIVTVYHIVILFTYCDPNKMADILCIYPTNERWRYNVTNQWSPSLLRKENNMNK